MTAGLAASVVAGTARTVAALGALATRTLTALEVLAVALGGTLGASRGLGLVETIERDLAAIVDLDDDDLDLVAHVEDILDLLHAALGDAGNVQQAVLAGQQVHEGAERLDGDHATGVLLARLGNLDDELDALDGLIDGLAGAADKDGAVFLNVDRSAGLVLDAADDLAAGTDDVADLIGRNLDGDDARSGAARGMTRLGDHIEHLLQDEGATLLGLLQGAGQDIEGEAGGLVVHLQGGDALGGASDLKVHVAQEVLETLDVGQDHGLALLLDQAHGDTGDRALNGHAAVHKGERGAAGRSHRRGAVGLHDLGDHTDSVGELVLVGKHRKQGALGQVAVTDLAALGAAHAAGLAGAERREVVVVHVALALGGLDGIQTLALVEHAERQDGEHLGLTTLEQAGAVNERQVVVLHHDGTNLVDGTAVDALAGLDDHGAHGLLLELLECHGDLALPGGLLLVGELGADGLLQSLDLTDAGKLVGVAQGSGHLVVVGENALLDLLDGLVERVLLLDDGAVDLLPLGDELVLGLAEGSKGLLAKLHSGEHVVLGDLLGAGLDHRDEVGRAAQLQVQVGVLALLIGGVDDKLAGLHVAADAHAGKRTLEGHAAERHGQRGAHDVDNVEGVDLVGDERGGDDVHLVAETVREARANRAVDHTGRERGLLAGTALALEVATRDTAGSVHLLVEVDGQREEVVILALLGDDHGVEHRGVALLDQTSAGGLLGKLAGLEGVGLAVQLKGLGYECHCSPLPHRPLACGLLM